MKAMFSSPFHELNIPIVSDIPDRLKQSLIAQAAKRRGGRRPTAGRTRQKRLSGHQNLLPDSLLQQSHIYIKRVC
jgi:hypothetical protein